MSLRIVVKSTNGDQKEARRKLAERVVTEFGSVPDKQLLCFFDDEDSQVFKDFLGATNRGFYVPINDGLPGEAGCPAYIADELLLDDGDGVRKRAFDHFIYLHGSTCEDSAAMVMTFAHELRHFLQGISDPITTSASRLALGLKGETGNPPDWNDWFCIPHEREARIVAKRVALSLVGKDATEAYIAKRIGEGKDVRDWEFIQRIEPAETYDLRAAVLEAYRRHLRPYRDDLVKILERQKSDYPDFGVEDLDRLLSK